MHAKRERFAARARGSCCRTRISCDDSDDMLLAAVDMTICGISQDGTQLVQRKIGSCGFVQNPHLSALTRIGLHSKTAPPILARAGLGPAWSQVHRLTPMLFTTIAIVILYTVYLPY